MSDHMKINWSKADASAQIAVLQAELETVKGEWDAYKTEYEDACVDGMKQAARAESAEAKLAGGEAVKEIVKGLRFAASANSNRLQQIDAVDKAIAFLSALTHPVPTHEDGSGERHPNAVAAAVHEKLTTLRSIGETVGRDHTSGEVTEAMVERAVDAYLNDPTWRDSSHAKMIADGCRDGMRAALEAALRGEAS